MEKKDILHTLKLLRENAKKRNFNQSIDIVVSLKDIDIKKENNKIDQFLTLPHDKGKKIKVCALVDKQLLKNAKENCDYAILNEEFSGYDKKQIKKLANECGFFIAQVNIMTEIAKHFGKILGPKGKMPNPKAGCVIPGNADLKPLVTKLQKTVRLITKNEPTIKLSIGYENMKDEELTENIIFIYNLLIESLPQGKQNLKSFMLKSTMGKPYLIGEQNESAGMEKTRS